MNHWLKKRRDIPHIIISSEKNVFVHTDAKGYLNKDGEWNSKGLDLYPYVHAIKLLKRMGYKRFFASMWADNNEKLFYIEEI